MSGLEELRRLETEATSGHWYVETMGNHRSDVLATHEDGALVICEHAGIDAEFIVAARNQLPRLLDALDAVLALHVPYPEGCEWPGVPGECSGCRTEEDMCCGDHTWPCPTVAAITKALEGKQ